MSIGRVQFTHRYEHIISLENLLSAWSEFVIGKKSRKDVQIFQQNLMRNIISLHKDLITKNYKHSEYEAFNISDSKPRNIHKASVRDRLLHHAIYRQLYPFFDKTFISDSYSCRFNKGTQKAIKAFHRYSEKISQNGTRKVWVLKCDVRRFFASIDQSILIDIIDSYISDKDIVWLISQIVKSFYITEGVGLPLGNLTSQLLVNVYMNKCDQFVKHKIKAKYYIRYADDFVILSENKEWLLSILPRIQDFLEEKLKLHLHPNKISITNLALGLDLLGWVHFTDHKVLRTVTKKRMFKNIEISEGKEEVVQSYIGLLSHGNTKKLRNKLIGGLVYTYD
jgi:RNA-directed DNA polymerase